MLELKGMQGSCAAGSACRERGLPSLRAGCRLCSRGCRQGCPGLWCRAGSLLCPRGCVPGQGLCCLPGSALSLARELPRGCGEKLRVEGAPPAWQGRVLLLPRACCQGQAAHSLTPPRGTAQQNCKARPT